MIPNHAADIPDLISEINGQSLDVRGIFSTESPEGLLWRPSPQKWSVVGHMAHLCILNEPYMTTMQACLMKARAKGWRSNGPYKHPWFGRWFTGQMAPPPKKRWTTAKNMVPDPSLHGADVLKRFLTAQGALAQLADDCTGIDLGKARFSSPFAKIIRLSLGTGFSVLVAHNRRHIWLAREVMASQGFPRTGA